MLRNRFFKWCGSSLIGHVVLIQLICAVPLSLMFILVMASEGTLTVAWGLFVVLLDAVLFAIGAALFWYTYSKPLIKRRGYK